MKIAHITPCFAPATAYGGPVESVTGLSRALAQRHHSVRVLATDADGPRTLESVPKGVETPWEDGLTVRYCRRWAREAISPELLARLSSYVQWADVVHVEAVYSFPTLPTLALCRAFHKPLVWSPRGALEHWSGTRRRAAKAVYEALCKILLPERIVLHVTSVSEGKKSRERLPGVATAVVPNGVDAAPATEHVGEGPVLRLVYLGRLDAKKGVDNLLAACARLNGGMAKPWHLTIAGFGERRYERHLLDVIAREGLQDRVTLAGAVHAAAKEKIFREADLFVVPSFMENFCLVVAEALAHGVPVIASQGTPWAGLVERRCGYWVNNSAESLTRAITEMSHEPLAEMGTRGRAWVGEEFTWSRVAEQMETVYQTVLGHSR